MIQLGKFIGKWCILRPSGFGYFECSNGKQVIKVAKENIEKGIFEGDLMFDIAIDPIKKSNVKPKKKPVIKKKRIAKKKKI